MTDPAFGTLVDPHTIRFQRDLPGPIERVWAYLTEPGLLATWLARGDIPRRPGAEFCWTWAGDADEPGGELRGRTRVYDPPHVLEYDWIEANAPGGSITASCVRFELEARGSNVRLTLTHRALPPGAFGTIGAGWHAHLDTLAAQLAGVEGPGADARYAALAPRYAAVTPPEPPRTGRG